MEAVLYESANGVSGKNENKNSVNSDNKESECVYKNGYSFLNKSSQRLPVDINFENVTFTATEGKIFGRKTPKEILHKVNGRFPPGQLIAIMGPSGAGKSTLLDVLSSYRIHGIGGVVCTNGRERNLKQFRKISCYITQDDRLQPLLTVEESMQIAADLKLPTTVPQTEKMSIIDRILSTLGLLQTKKTKVAGLSGGQKKRMSIALELISDPLVMFLDEPTTGLDSSSCMTCIRLLKNLAKEGRTIVCTIHQPSASLFELFDQVYVLAAGNCLYQGSTDNLVPFLEAVGSPCPMYHNPADYVIEIASGEYGDQLMSNMIKSTNNGRSLAYFKDPDHLSSMRVQKDESAKELDQSGLVTSQFNQLKVLLRRGVIKSKRDSTLTYLRIGVNIMVGMMLGSVYWKAGSDGSKVLDNYNLLFSLLMHHMMSTMMLTILTFPSELSILIKEHFNRWYSLKMYYLATTLVDIPLSVFCTFIFSAILYWMTDQPMEWNRFHMFFITSTLTVFVAQSFGLMIGAYFNVVNGTFLGPTLSVPMMMFAGFGVRLSDLPPYLYWGCYISYLRFSLEGLVGAVYGLQRKPLDCPDEVDICLFRDPKELLKEVGVPGDQFDNDVVALLLFVFVLRVAAFVMLKCKLMAVR